MVPDIRIYLIRNKIVIIIFSIILLCSFCFHLYNRNTHFQELDSNGVYYVLNNFPYSAMNGLNLSYSGAGIKLFSSLDAVKQFFDQPMVDGNLKKMLGSSYSETRKAMIIDKIYNGKPIFFYLRSAEVIALSKIFKYLPPPIFSMVVLPFSSTYSPGPGFLYGFLGVHGSYGVFMSWATALHILIFHLSVLLIFLLILLVSKNKWTALTVGLIPLFSYSLYSYGYHLGSTVWTVFVSAIFLLSTVYYYKRSDADIRRKMSVLSAILLLFSYLVVFYWVAAMFVLALIDRNDGKNIFERDYFLDLLKSQWVILSSAIICVAFFLPFGQSFHGNPQGIGQFFVFLYFIILNCFSFFTKVNFLQVTQFIIVILLLIGGLYLGYKNRKNRNDAFVFYLASAILLVYCLASVGGILSFIPARHILFLVPAILLIIFFSIDRAYSYLPDWLIFLINIIIVGLGFYSLILSQAVTSDQTLFAKINPTVSKVVIYGDHYQFLYRYPIEYQSFLKKNNVKLSDQIMPNTKYQYVSQNNCLNDLLADAATEGMNIKIENKLEFKTDQKFIAYDPTNIGFNYLNNFCQGEFTWLKK